LLRPYLKTKPLTISIWLYFRPKLSTSTALAFFTDTILENADNGLIFLDFSKAFDTVDHGILLRKLKSFGLDNNSLNWFESYLTNRQQLENILLAIVEIIE
jgi:hypothetical protein